MPRGGGGGGSGCDGLRWVAMGCAKPRQHKSGPWKSIGLRDCSLSALGRVKDRAVGGQHTRAVKQGALSGVLEHVHLWKVPRHPPGQKKDQPKKYGKVPSDSRKEPGGQEKNSRGRSHHFVKD